MFRNMLTSKLMAFLYDLGLYQREVLGLVVFFFDSLLVVRTLQFALLGG